MGERAVLRGERRMKMKKILVWLILILSGFYVGAVTGVILVDL